MRIAIAVLVVAAACHQPSLKDRALGFGNKIVGVAHRIDASISPEAKAQIKGFVVAEARAKVSQVVAEHVPVVADDAPPVDPSDASDASADTADASADTQPAPPAQPAMMPATVVVHARGAAPASTFVARYKTAGGAWTCTAHATMAACSASCTEIARQAIAARSDAQCSCLEDTACR